MEDMKDEIIYESLKQAIVQAFFSQQTYIDPNGYQRSYGGVMVQLIEKILNSEDMKKLIQSMSDEIAKKKKSEIEKSLIEAYEKKVVEAVDKYVNEGNYYFNDFVKRFINEKAESIVKDKISNSKELAQKIAEQVDTNGYDLDIKVNVSVTKKLTN